MQALKQSVSRRLALRGAEPFLADSLLRFQRGDREEGNREVEIPAPESGRTRISCETGGVATVQLSTLPDWGRRNCRDRIGVDGAKTGEDGDGVIPTPR